jgi:hypothetical protein
MSSTPPPRKQSQRQQITKGAVKLKAWRKLLDNIRGTKLIERESQRALGGLLSMSWQMVASIESAARRPGLDLAVRIQAVSAEFALLHAKQLAEAGLQLPIRCEDWRRVK